MKMGKKEKMDYLSNAFNRIKDRATFLIENGQRLSDDDDLIKGAQAVMYQLDGVHCKLC